VVRIADPPPRPSAIVDPITYILPAKTDLYRILNSDGGKYRGDSLRTGVARHRFDHHISSDPKRAILYCAPTFECCIVEKFGDSRVIEFDDHRYCMLMTLAPLRLLDLREWRDACWDRLRD